MGSPQELWHAANEASGKFQDVSELRVIELINVNQWWVQTIDLTDEGLHFWTLDNVVFEYLMASLFFALGLRDARARGADPKEDLGGKIEIQQLICHCSWK